MYVFEDIFLSILLYFFIGVEEMAQWMKCILCKHGELSVDPEPI